MAYMIKVTPQYYAGTINAPQEHYLRHCDVDDRSDDLNIIYYDSKEAAKAVVESLRVGTYYLAHGEAARPYYQIIDEEVGDDLPDCLPGTGCEFSGWEEIQESDVQEHILSILNSGPVDYYYAGDTYDVYNNIVDDPGSDARYMIVFCPRTAAMQLYDGDLSLLDWSHPSYYREL